MPGGEAVPPLTALLLRLARRYRWVEGAQRFAARAWMGPAAALGVLVLARLRPVAGDRAWALGLGLGLLVLLAALAWGRRVSLLEAARRCDRDLGLADRLATACAMAGELAAAEAPEAGASTAPRSGDSAAPPARLLLLRRQRDDAWQRAQDLDPRALIRLRLNPRPVLAFVVLTALSLHLGLVPNPQHGALAGRQRIRQAAARVAAEVRRQEAALREASNPAARVPADAAAALGRLAERLEDSQGRAEADLAALGEAEQQLRRAQDPGALRRGAQAEALAERLGQLAEQAEQAARSADGDAAAAAAGAAARATAAATGAAEPASSEDLARLADAAGSLAAGERQALAADLRAAAAGSLADGGASARAMEDLAQALERGDAAAARRAADALGQAVDAAQREGASAAAVQQALDSLATGRRDLAQANAGAAPGEAGSQAGSASQAGGAAQAGAPESQAGSASQAGGAAQAGAPESQAGSASQAGGAAQAGAPESQAGSASQAGGAAQAGAPESQAGSASQAGGAAQAGAGPSAARAGQDAASIGGRVSGGQQPGGGAGRGAVASDLVYAPPQRLGVAGEQSFVPGQAGEDGSGFRQGQAREPGQGASGRVPFAQVLPAYRAAAARALDRAQVPAARRDYVRSYFAQLDE